MISTDQNMPKYDLVKERFMRKIEEQLNQRETFTELEKVNVLSVV